MAEESITSFKESTSRLLLDSCNFFLGNFGLKYNNLKDAQSIRIRSKMMDEYNHISSDNNIINMKQKDTQSTALTIRSNKPTDKSSSDKPWNTTTMSLAIKKKEDLPDPEWRAPWKLMRVISGHTGWVRSIAVDPSNDWFVTGGADSLIKIWDLASGGLKLTLVGHINTVRGLAVSGKQPYLFSCSEDRTVKCWDLETNKVVRNYHGHLSGVHCLTLHPTADVLMTGGRDSAVRVWDIRTKKEIYCLSGHAGTVNCVIAKGGGIPELISGSADKMVRLWDIRMVGKSVQTLTHHKKGIRALGWVQPGGESGFISGAADNFKLWRTGHTNLNDFSGSNNEIAKFERDLDWEFGGMSVPNCMATRDDGLVVSGFDNGLISFWDLDSGCCTQSLKSVVQPGSLDSENGVFCMSFDHSQSRLITGECDKTIKVWKEDETATAESHPLIFNNDKYRKYIESRDNSTTPARKRTKIA